jgi:hypothetical protein
MGQVQLVKAHKLAEDWVDVVARNLEARTLGDIGRKINKNQLTSRITSNQSSIPISRDWRLTIDYYNEYYD